MYDKSCFENVRRRGSRYDTTRHDRIGRYILRMRWKILLSVLSRVGGDIL